MIPLEEIQQRAKKLGLTRFEHLGKNALVHAIQEKEGHDACFDAPWSNVCEYERCDWKEDCQSRPFDFS